MWPPPRRAARSRRWPPFGRGRRGRTRGYTLLELVFASALLATIGSAAVPQMLVSLDDYKTTGAARYVAARLQQVRMDAVVRSTEVAVQFVELPDGVHYRVYIDGNRNGVRTRDIQRGVDTPLTADERLPDQFSGVDFGVLPNLPGVEGGAPPGTDPLSLGASNLVSFSPHGTSSTGSLYIKGRRNAQCVVRIFGETGKTRVLKFVAATRQWRPL